MPAVAAAAGKGFEELAGKAYYVRSAIDGIRFAAGMRQRAAFYAVDEAMRAVLASGVKLTSILPVIGTISLAATAGYLIWKDYGGSMETTAEKAKRLGDELKKIPDLLANIETAQKGGNLTAAQADSFRDILSGRTPIYRKSGSSGSGGAYDITTDAGQYGTSGRMRGRWIQNPPADVNNPNDLKQAMAMIQSKRLCDDNATGQIKSQNEIADLLKRNNEEALQGIAKERQEAADKYAEDKQKLLDLAVTAKLSKTQLNADLATLDADYAAKKKNLDDKEAAEKQRVNAEVQKSYDEMLAEQSSLEQSIAEQQKKETEELDKQLQLKQEIARAQIQANLDAIKSNPFLTELQKAQEEVPVLAAVDSAQRAAYCAAPADFRGSEDGRHRPACRAKADDGADGAAVAVAKRNDGCPGGRKFFVPVYTGVDPAPEHEQSGERTGSDICRRGQYIHSQHWLQSHQRHHGHGDVAPGALQRL